LVKHSLNSSKTREQIPKEPNEEPKEENRNKDREGVIYK
jgi:hypothetical protein